MEGDRASKQSKKSLPVVAGYQTINLLTLGKYKKPFHQKILGNNGGLAVLSTPNFRRPIFRGSIFDSFEVTDQITRAKRPC